MADRSWILSGVCHRGDFEYLLTQPRDINNRLDVVQEVHDYGESRAVSGLLELLSGLPDLEKGLCRIQYGSVRFPLPSTRMRTDHGYSVRHRSYAILLKHSTRSQINSQSIVVRQMLDVTQASSTQPSLCSPSCSRTWRRSWTNSTLVLQGQGRKSRCGLKPPSIVTLLTVAVTCVLFITTLHSANDTSHQVVIAIDFDLNQELQTGAAC